MVLLRLEIEVPNMTEAMLRQDVHDIDAKFDPVGIEPAAVQASDAIGMLMSGHLEVDWVIRSQHMED